MFLSTRAALSAQPIKSFLFGSLQKSVVNTYQTSSFKRTISLLQPTTKQIRIDRQSNPLTQNTTQHTRTRLTQLQTTVHQLNARVNHARNIDEGIDGLYGYIAGQFSNTKSSRDSNLQWLRNQHENFSDQFNLAKQSNGKPDDHLQLGAASHTLTQFFGGSKAQSDYAFKEIVKCFLGQVPVKQAILAQEHLLPQAQKWYATDLTAQLLNVLLISDTALLAPRKGIDNHHVQRAIEACLRIDKLTNKSIEKTFYPKPNAEKDRDIVLETMLSQFERLNIPLRLDNLVFGTYGSSSSHGIGPMQAMRHVLCELEDHGQLANIQRIDIDLKDSLGATGLAHNTHLNLIAALLGITNVEFDSSHVAQLKKYQVKGDHYRLPILGNKDLPEIDVHLHWQPKEKLYTSVKLEDQEPSKQFTLPNGLSIRVTLDQTHADKDENIKRKPNHFQRNYYSIGGGFILPQPKAKQAYLDTYKSLNKSLPPSVAQAVNIFPNQNPYFFTSTQSLIENLNSLGHHQLSKYCKYFHRAEGIGSEKLKSQMLDIVRIMRRNVGQAVSVPKKMIKDNQHRMQAAIFAEAQDKTPPLNNVLTQTLRAGANAAHANIAPACAAGVEGFDYGEKVQCVLGATLGSSGVLAGHFFALLDLLDLTDRNVEEIPFSIIENFLSAAFTMLVITKNQSTHAAAAGGCQAEVGNSTVAGAAGFFYALYHTEHYNHLNDAEKLNATITSAYETMAGFTGLSCTPDAGRVGNPCAIRNGQSIAHTLASIKHAPEPLTHEDLQATLLEYKEPNHNSIIARLLNFELPNTPNDEFGYVEILNGAKQQRISEEHLSKELFKNAGLLDSLTQLQQKIGANLPEALRETDEGRILKGTGDSVFKK